ncbi:MAG: DivIVA domain-containing protein [Actinomycetota bacterium]|nr:DivIVA domain-containing protein [Actinomycetota bacterium]|tara:strand:+ start:893 stop:1498 length:606 start_codon:yes stop_codon:yes gene_type:complete
MKFKIVKINGYKIKEVDLFLRKLNKWQADGKSKTIATKLQRVKFSLTNKKGYDPKEVDDYLDSLLNPKALNPNTLSNAGIELDYAKDQVLTPAPTITSKRLRELSPPLVEEIGYEKAEVDKFLNLIADTLQLFEESTHEEIQKIKADQYDPDSETPKLLSADQIRWVLFTVNDEHGYDILAIDAAVNRLSDALEYHWRKSV